MSNLRIELLDPGGTVVGTATLDDGRFVGTGELAQAHRLTVLEPDSLHRLHPVDGDPWLKALRYVFRGGWRRAVEVHERAAPGPRESYTPAGIMPSWPDAKLQEHLKGKHDQHTHGRKYAALALQGKEGGFTHNIVDTSSPTTGYTLSPYPEREEHVAASDLTAGHVRDYAKRNDDLLRQPGHFLGSWRDGDDVYLDVSVNLADRDAATKLGRERDQKAIWDVEGGEAVDLDG